MGHGVGLHGVHDLPPIPQRTRKGWGTELACTEFVEFGVDREVHATAGREAGATDSIAKSGLLSLIFDP
jgi:hypothetical protein